MRDHLQNTQWATPAIAPDQIARRQARPHLFPQRPNETRFTIQELNAAVDSTKSNKAPGPDEAPAELFGPLDQDSREQLLHMYNEIWDTSTLPADWGWAKLVSIFKGKGADTEAEKLSSYFASEHFIQSTGSYAPKNSQLNSTINSETPSSGSDHTAVQNSHCSACAKQWSGH